jgi:hypothetical protein
MSIMEGVPDPDVDPVEGSSIDRILSGDDVPDLTKPVLVIEVYSDPHAEREGITASFVIMEIQDVLHAETVVSLFWDHPGLLVDVTAILASVGLAEASIRILWTNQAAEYIATCHEFGVLKACPHVSFVDEDAWSVFSAWVRSDPDTRMHPLDLRDAMVFLPRPSSSSSVRIDEASNAMSMIRDRADRRRRRSTLLRSGVLRSGSIVVSPGFNPFFGKHPGATYELRNLSLAMKLMGPDLSGPGSVDSVMEGLRAKAPWMSDAIDVVEERLWMFKSTGRNWASLAPMMIHGPSGSGKSYFARILAQALCVGFSSMSLSGVSTSAEMRGMSAAWENARPSWPVRSISALACPNPILLVDDVDRMGRIRRGDPVQVACSMLDHSSEGAYPDVGLGLPCDISHASWIFTAVSLQGVDRRLIDHLVVVKAGEIAVDHLDILVASVAADLASDLGIGTDRLEWPDEREMDALRMLHRMDKSLRTLSGAIAGGFRRRLVEASKSAD